jgi:hypothetical protein
MAQGVKADPALRARAVSLYLQGLSAVMVEKETGVSRTTVRWWAHQDRPREGVVVDRAVRLRRHPVDVDAFRRELTPETAWVLGVIVGDGCVVRHKGTIRGVDVVGDEDVCRKVGAILGSTAPVRKQGRQEGGWHQIRVNSPELAKSLGVLGVMPDKAHTVAWPPIPRRLLPHFLRGVWDADGCVTTTGKGHLALSLRMSSRAFMGAAHGVLCELTGSKAQLTESRDGSFFLQLTCAKARMLASFLWGASLPEMRGERKFQKFLAIEGRAR